MGRAAWPPARSRPARAAVADPPLAGLAANARPDPADIPNNHWSYAVQWFLFAGTALVIYALALRKRLRWAGFAPIRAGLTALTVA
jgi:surfeit locus 1 family protein